MSTTTAEKLKTIDGCFGNYPQTQALKNGSITSDRIALRLTEVNPIYKSFFMMVRELKFDVCEIALVTYLQAKAFGKPLTLMPATMMGRFQHGTLLYNSERGTLTPDKLSKAAGSACAPLRRRPVAGSAASCGRITASISPR